MLAALLPLPGIATLETDLKVDTIQIPVSKFGSWCGDMLNHFSTLERHSREIQI